MASDGLLRKIRARHQQGEHEGEREKKAGIEKESKGRGTGQRPLRGSQETIIDHCEL